MLQRRECHCQLLILASAASPSLYPKESGGDGNYSTIQFEKIYRIIIIHRRHECMQIFDQNEIPHQGRVVVHYEQEIGHRRRILVRGPEPSQRSSVSPLGTIPPGIVPVRIVPARQPIRLYP